MAGDSLKTQHRGLILLGGPAEDEIEMRQKLFERVYEWLDSACPDRFGVTTLPERIAYDIAQAAQYHVTKSKKRVLVVKALDVNYRNPPKWWKQWIRIRDDEDVGESGSPA